MSRAEQDYRELGLLEIIKMFFFSRIKKSNNKQSFSLKKQTPPPPPPEGVSINHIAIVLDGRVEEVIRCENRLAALLLSNPDFIEFDPEQIKVLVGKTEYSSNQFKNSEEGFSEEYIDEMIQKEKEKKNND
jgi:hypothetical protein